MARRESGRNPLRSSLFRGTTQPVANWADVPGQSLGGATTKVGILAYHPDGIDRVEFSADGVLFAVIREKSLNTATADVIPGTTDAYPGTTAYWADFTPSTTPGATHLIEAIVHPKRHAGRPRPLAGTPFVPKPPTGYAPTLRGFYVVANFTRPADVHVTTQAQLDAARATLQNGQRVFFDAPGQYDIAFKQRLGSSTLTCTTWVEFIATVDDVEICSRSNSTVVDVGTRVLRLTAGSTNATQISQQSTLSYWGRTNAPTQGVGVQYAGIPPTAESPLSPTPDYLQDGTLVLSTYPATSAVTLTKTAAVSTPVDRAGTLTNGSAVVTGLSSTVDLAVGMMVLGNGISSSARPNGLYIASINSGTQITLSGAATTGGSQTLSFGVLVKLEGGLMQPDISMLKFQNMRFRTDFFYQINSSTAWFWTDKCSYEENSPYVPAEWSNVEVPKPTQPFSAPGVYHTNHYSNKAGFGVASATYCRNLYQGNVYDYHQSCTVVIDSIVFGHDLAGGDIIIALHHADIAQQFNGNVGVYYENIKSLEPLEDVQTVFVNQDTTIPGQGMMGGGALINMDVQNTNVFNAPAFSQLQGPINNLFMKDLSLGTQMVVTTGPAQYNANYLEQAVRLTAGSTTAQLIGLGRPVWSAGLISTQYCSNSTATAGKSGLVPWPDWIQIDTLAPSCTSAGVVTLEKAAVRTTPADRTGVVTAGSPVITGLSSTSDLVVGMMVLGTGLTASSTSPNGFAIKSIDSSSQITLESPATASATGTDTTLSFGILIKFMQQDRGRTLRYNNIFFDNVVCSDAIAEVGGLNHRYLHNKYTMGDRISGRAGAVPAGAAAPICLVAPSLVVKGNRPVAVGEILKPRLQLYKNWDRTPGIAPRCFDWQWYRDGVLLTGARGAVRVITADDAGHTLALQVKAYNGYGHSMTVMSTPLAIPA
jgi:hypothetical protein